MGMIYAHSTERWFLHVMDGCMRAHTRRTGYTLAVEDDEGSWRVPKAFTRDTEPLCHSFFFFLLLFLLERRQVILCTRGNVGGWAGLDTQNTNVYKEYRTRLRLSCGRAGAFCTQHLWRNRAAFTRCS